MRLALEWRAYLAAGNGNYMLNFITHLTQCSWCCVLVYTGLKHRQLLLVLHSKVSQTCHGSVVSTFKLTISVQVTILSSL